MQTLDAGTGEEVSRGDLVKGYQIAKGEYVLFDKDELDAVKLESTRIIDSDLLYDQERMLHHEIEDLTPV
jgi:non-homologous end joining protein Ku